MPLFSEHISNMYYSGSPSYTSVPYSYSSSPYGTSYSASYLNPGGNYSNHSSLVPYTRSLSSRWLGRNYSPILSTISEKGTTSPVRINSPRRTPVTRHYTSHLSIPTTTTYTSKPININTADIDVSRDKYRNKTTSTQSNNTESQRTSPVKNNNNEVSSYVGEKPNTGVDSSPGSPPLRSTIKRDRPVVRLHTVKRKDRDSPRQPNRAPSENIERNISSTEEKEKSETLKWRERLAEDLVYKNKKEKKTIGEQLIEKFTLKDKDKDKNEAEISSTEVVETCKESLSEHTPDIIPIENNKSPGRRCSMEHLAEEASLLDSLIRRENLSTATLDLSKIGNDTDITNVDDISNKKKRKFLDKPNPLTSTKSEHSLFSKPSMKRKSLRKSTSGDNIRILDRISEIPQLTNNEDLTTVEGKRLSIKRTKTPKMKQKSMPKITSSVEVSTPTRPLKFFVENVTVEEKPLPKKKDTVFSITNDVKDIDEPKLIPANDTGHRKSVKIKVKQNKTTSNITTEDVVSPEPEDGNFWGKIGKRETVYLLQRRKELENANEKNKRSLFWFPEEDADSSTIPNDNNKLSECNQGITEVQDVTEAKDAEPIIAVVDLSNTSDVKNSSIDMISEEKATTSIKGLKKLEMSLDVKVNEDINNIVNVTANKQEIKNAIKVNEEHTGFVESITVEDTKSSNTKKSDDLKTEAKSETPSSTMIKTNSGDKNRKIKVVKKIPKSKEDICESIPNKNISDKIKEKDVDHDNTSEKISKVQSKQGEITAEPSSETKTLNKTAIEDAELIDKNNTDTQFPNNSENKIPCSPTIANNTIEDHEKVVELQSNEDSQDGGQFISIQTESDLQPSNDVCKQSNKSDEQDKKQPPAPYVPQSDKVESIKEKKLEVNDLTPNESDIDIPPGDIEKIAVTPKTEDVKTETKVNENLKQESIKKPIQNTGLNPLFANKKPVKDEPALRPLIATPRPLQKKPPQVIHSSSSSETSSSEDSSEEEDESSESSADFYECENTVDGRTSTGSNDSGFDSSAPTSPSGFTYARKDCDVNCHRKCEKLTANLCGVNQRLLVEALASRTASKRGADHPSTSSGSTPAQTNNHDIVQQELEQSTAYGLFKKTGRFTPPARSIPRFRKYTIDDFQFIKVLGKGSFGKVMLAELKDTEYYYAVKCLKKDVVLEDDDVECTLIERKVLALGTNHPYLCHLFATFQTDSHLFFVMEYLNGGDLMFHIQQSGRFPEPRARFYAAEIVSGLKFLHKRGIVYRDLKLDNILLDFDGHVRIADFGMCKLQIYLDKTADTFCGTPDYMAPEIIKGLKYNQTVDWWSFGVLLYEMLIGQSPFSGCDEDELFWSICNEMPSYPRFLSTESLSILTRLLDKDAHTRLGGIECMHGDIRDQAFFHQIHWDKLERRELEAPFKPRVRHPLDTQYFDRAFTGERPRLTAVEPQVLRSMDQEPFRGFSYTNPNATDR